MKQPKQQPLRIVRGTTNTIELDLTDATGQPYVLTEGSFLLFGVKQSVICTACCLTKEITGANDAGVYSFALKPEDTAGLPFGRYYYDIGLQIGEDYFPVVECSPFEIAHNITERRA